MKKWCKKQKNVVKKYGVKKQIIRVKNENARPQFRPIRFSFESIFWTNQIFSKQICRRKDCFKTATFLSVILTDIFY